MPKPKASCLCSRRLDLVRLIVHHSLTHRALPGSVPTAPFWRDRLSHCAGGSKRRRDLIRLIVIVSVVAALLVLLIPNRGDSTPSRVSSPQHEGAKQEPKPQCALAMQKIREHRTRTWALQRTLGARPPIRVSTSAIVGCRYARWVEHLWWKRSVAWAKRAKWIALPNTHDWETAVRVVQRVYPGTESWLLSCSSAEGGHGKLVWYGGRAWSGRHIGNDFLGMDTVLGWMQYRWSTYRVYEPDAFATARRRGFVIPKMVTPLGGDPKYAGWTNPLGQALTAGYMRFFHKDGHHWAASWGRGC